MGTFNLTWMPPGGLSSIAQQVQYKVASASSWVTAATLGATDDSYVVENLQNNVVYDFRIVNVCSSGGNVPSSAMKGIDFVCPTVQITPTSDSGAFSFAHLGGDISSYEVDLLDGAGLNILDTKTIIPSGNVVSDSFENLSPTTQYRLQVTMHAGVYSKVCGVVVFTTTVVPTCSLPSGLVVSIS